MLVQPLTDAKVFYKQELEFLSFLKHEIYRIEHIGSTYIGSIYTKPIVDIAAEVVSLERTIGLASTFEKLGYTVLGEQGVSGRCIVSRNISEKFKTRIHFYQNGHENFKKMILFRDYLVNHPDLAKEYELLKIQLSKASNDPYVYHHGKSEFINCVVEKAESEN